MRGKVLEPMDKTDSVLTDLKQVRAAFSRYIPTVRKTRNLFDSPGHSASRMRCCTTLDHHRLRDEHASFCRALSYANRL